MNQIGIIISIALILRILSGRKISKVSLVLVSCTIPFFGMYWCFFSIGLVTFAVIGNLHKRKIREDLIRLLMLVSLTTAVMVLVDFYKTLTFWQTHGTIGTLQRTIIQTEAWSFRIIDLLLVPSYANFVPSFLRRDVALNGSLVFGEASGMFSPLGIVVLLLCLAMVVACFNLGFEKTSNYFFQSRLVESTEQYAFLFLGIICTPLIGSMGGIGSILNLFSLSPIKSWERLSVVFQILSCYVIVSIVHLIGRAAPDMLTKLKKNPVVKWRATVLVVLAVSVPVTLFWSIPLDWNRNFTSAQAQQSSDKEFFSKVEEIVGNQMVFTFPVEMYPEGPEVCKSIPYASIFGFIYTKNTRWSGGAIDGRDSDWQAAVNSKPIEDASNRLFDIGFAGMVFDSWGYSPEAYSELKMTLKNASRSELLLSRDSRWLFVRLTDLFNFDGSFKAPGSFKRILRPKEDTALLEASMANLKASYTCPSR